MFFFFLTIILIVFSFFFSSFYFFSCFVCFASLFFLPFLFIIFCILFFLVSWFFSFCFICVLLFLFSFCLLFSYFFLFSPHFPFVSYLQMPSLKFISSSSAVLLSLSCLTFSNSSLYFFLVSPFLHLSSQMPFLFIDHLFLVSSFSTILSLSLSLPLRSLFFSIQLSSMKKIIMLFFS